MRRSRWRPSKASLGAAVALAIVAYGVYTLANSQNIAWRVVWEFLFDPSILAGVKMTLELTLLGFFAGSVLGVMLAIMRLSVSSTLRAMSGAYVWFFRGTPLLVQIIFWFNVSLFVPRLTLGFTSVDTNTVISPFTAAMLALSLNLAAYMAEVVRAGISSVDHGQTEAALAIGMTSRQAMFRIVLPQAARTIVPPAANIGIDLLKASALVSVIGTQELMTKTQSIYSRNFYVIELLMVACAWYLLMTTVAYFGQTKLEDRLSRGVVGGRRG